MLEKVVAVNKRGIANHKVNFFHFRRLKAEAMLKMPRIAMWISL
ncbi:MAG: hypothetical protein QXK78_04905 [Candidatus Bathyarchaeia archaeon]